MDVLKTANQFELLGKKADKSLLTSFSGAEIGMSAALAPSSSAVLLLKMEGELKYKMRPKGQILQLMIVVFLQKCLYFVSRWRIKHLLCFNNIFKKEW